MSETMIIDGHSDIVIDVGKRWHRGERGRLGAFHVPRMLRGGVTGAWCPIAVDNPSHPGDPFERALRTLEAAFDEVARAGSDVEIVHHAPGFEAAMRNGRVALFLGMEGGMPLGGHPERVGEFYRMGLRWFGLTWNVANEIGGGLGNPAGGGLTPVGAEIVAEMERLGAVIDLTHASPALVADVFARTTAPLAVTHSNARCLCDHVRNLDDEQLAWVRERNGIVGVNLFPALLAPAPEDASMDHVVQHAVYLRDRVGAEGVAFGFDFIDYDQEAMAAGLVASSVDYGDRVTYPEGVRDTTEAHNVLVALRAAGWDAAAVDSIAWRNQLRFIAEVQACSNNP